MINKKGFTIPEMLAVIVILGILITISTGVYNGISQRLKETSLTKKIAYFKEKALEYAEEENIGNETISLNYLINLGYISAEYPENPEKERIGNPVTGGFLDCMNFTITKDLDEYAIDYDIAGSCDLVFQEQVASEITIEKYVKRNDDFVKITDEWVREPVYVLIKFANVNKYQVTDNKFDYMINGIESSKNGFYCQNLSPDLNTLKDCYNINVIDTDYIYNTSVKVSMSLQNKSGDNKVFKVSRDTPVKIDKDAPVLSVNYDKSYTKDTVSINLSGNDNVGSGISGYYFGQTRPDSADDFSSVTDYEAHFNGTYYAYTKDNAGNISEEKVININNIDKDGPVGFVSNGRTKWSTDDFTFTFGCSNDKDNKTGCANELRYTIIDITDGRNTVLANDVLVKSSQASYTVRAADESYVTAVTLKYTIKDNLGNTVTYGDKTPIKINTKIDKVTPKFTIKHTAKKRKGAFGLGYKGADYTLSITIDKQGPSGINLYGYSENKTDVENFDKYTNQQLERYFTKKDTHSIYVKKRKKKKVAARVISGSGKAAYGLIYLSGNGCTNYVAWTIGGIILGGFLAPAWWLLGGLIGWGICHAN